MSASSMSKDDVKQLEKEVHTSLFLINTILKISDNTILRISAHGGCWGIGTD
jgi:hypothetical protein